MSANILEQIFDHKQAEVSRQKQARPLAAVREEAERAPTPLDFIAALREASRGAHRSPALIAEVKRASPSRGVLLEDFDALLLAHLYHQNGAAAISVLTDERFFQGSLAYLRQIAGEELGLPLLCKDFINDPYQVYQSRAAGADAVLLIVTCLEPGLLRELYSLCLELGMAPLVEIHSLEELDIALVNDPMLLGVNNRNLHDFSVSLDTTLGIRPHIPQEICLVAESGIHTRQDIDRLAAAGVDAILVGEALVTARDIAAKVRSLS